MSSTTATSPGRFTRLLPVLAAASLVAALLGLAGPAAQPADARTDPPSGMWMPVVGEYFLWCTEANPGGGAPGAGVCDRPGAEHHDIGRPAIDISTTYGVPIYAAAAGVVTTVAGGCAADNSYGCNNGAGNYVVIDHGGHRTRYLHLTDISVSEGQTLEAADLVGTAGNSGSSANPHLHFDKTTDEDFGDRIPAGPLLACWGDEVVQYPQVLGVNSWKNAPYGSPIRNDGYACLGGPAVAASPAPAPPAPTVPDTPSSYTPVAPTRLFDTRTDEAPSGYVGAGRSIDVPVAGVGVVPGDATAVVLNVTATEAGAAGFVTVWPTGLARPTVSSLNLTEAGATVANLVVVPVGSDGSVSFYTQKGAHLLADVAGYFTAAPEAVSAGRIVPVPPSRLFDTRTALGPSGVVESRDAITVPVLGRAGLPTEGVAAVIVNVTATESQGAGYVTVWPSGVERPLASNLNLNGGGETVPNLAIVPLGADGSISVYAHSGSHLLGDVTGYVTDAAAPAGADGLFVPRSPERLFDTRSEWAPSGLVGAGETISVQVTGAAGDLPADASAIVFNVTATESVAPGFVTVWPGDLLRPLASVLNLGTDDTRAAASIMPIGADGSVAFFTQSGAHLLADVFGYLTG